LRKENKELQQELDDTKSLMDFTIESIVDNIMDGADVGSVEYDVYCKGVNDDMDCNIKHLCDKYIKNQEPVQQDLINVCGWFYDVEECVYGGEGMFQYFKEAE
jgi:hypothetical protein